MKLPTTEKEFQALTDNAATIVIHWKQNESLVSITGKDGNKETLEFPISPRGEQRTKDLNISEAFRKYISNTAKEQGLRAIEKTKSFGYSIITTYHFVGKEPKKISKAQQFLIRQLFSAYQHALLEDTVDAHKGLFSVKFNNATLNKLAEYGYILEFGNYIQLSSSGLACAAKDNPDLSLDAIKGSQEAYRANRLASLKLKMRYAKLVRSILSVNSDVIIEVPSFNQHKIRSYTFKVNYSSIASLQLFFNPYKANWQIKTMGMDKAITSNTLGAYTNALIELGSIMESLVQNEDLGLPVAD